MARIILAQVFGSLGLLNGSGTTVGIRALSSLNAKATTQLPKPLSALLVFLPLRGKVPAWTFPARSGLLPGATVRHDVLRTSFSQAGENHV
ncbi:hypothetical protein [Paracoccus actinidiae]|uniref:hypothetical protein n=1 Tax=Paracoccus actinidiae TaxID=3064531 RepID=UPI0027D23EDC|nr:hypothetical protein [Paracoccus sp. M09]